MLFCLKKAEPHLLELKYWENLPRILHYLVHLLTKIVQNPIVHVFPIHFSHYFSRVHLLIVL